MNEEGAYTKEQLEDFKNFQKNGIEGNGAKVFLAGPKNIRLYQCPQTWLKYETKELIRILFIFEKTNILPFSGAWLDQPYWFIEAYEIFKDEQNFFIEKERSDREKSKTNGRRKA